MGWVWMGAELRVEVDLAREDGSVFLFLVDMVRRV